MTREDIRRAFPEATEEQINNLLNIHSADIGRARGNATQLQADLQQAQADLAAARQENAQLQATAGTVQQLQQQVQQYQQQEQQRQQAEQAAQARQQLLSRMDAVLNGRQFIVDELRDLVADRFQAALGEQANVGRSDADVFEALVRDKGYFRSQAPGSGGEGGMPGPADLGGNDSMTREAFLKLSTADQAKYKKEHDGNFYALFPEVHKTE